MSKKCEHYWEYINTVFSSVRGGIYVRRRCSWCEMEQIGLASRWREPLEGELQTSIEDSAWDSCLEIL